MVLPRLSGSFWRKLLLLMKSKSRLRLNTSAGTTPAKVLNLRSRKSSLSALMTWYGKLPEKLLLLRSSSYKYLSLLRFVGITPVKLLEFAWKNTRSGNSVMKSVKVRSGPLKLYPLNLTPARAFCLKRGSVSQTNPL